MSRKKKFKEYSLDQFYLLPPDIRDWVPENDVSRFIDQLVEGLDLSEFEKCYKPGVGKPPYAIEMMVKVILYCFCNGIQSSRKMERATYMDLGARFLAGNQHPDHSSFANFKNRHHDGIKSLFTQVVIMCRQIGLLKLGHVAIDGTLLDANASKGKNVLISEIDEQIKVAENLYNNFMQAWEKSDQESEKKKLEQGMKVTKKQMKDLESLLENEKIQEQLSYQTKQTATSDSATQSNLEDETQQENSVISLYDACGKAGIDLGILAEKTGIRKARIGAFNTCERTPTETEKEAIFKVLEVDNIHFRPLSKETSTKTKTRSFANLTDPDSYPMGRPGKPTRQCYNAQIAVCSESQIISSAWVSQQTNDRSNLIPMLEQLEGLGLLDEINIVSADSGYYSKKVVTDDIAKGLDLFIPPGRIDKSKQYKKQDPIAKAMREKVASEEGRQVLRTRSATVEPVFGQIKSNLGFRRLLTRGLENVTQEWNIIATTHNILKMFKHIRSVKK